MLFCKTKHCLFEVNNQALRFLVTFCLQKVIKEKSKSLDGIEEKPQLLFCGVRTLPAASETANKHRNEN